MVTSGDVFSQTTIPFLNLSATPLPLSPDNAFLQDSFDIVDVQERGTSTLFFTKARDTGEHIVIKKLSQYKDTRYDLETVEKRNKCLREALKFNSRFTSGIFIGVARIREINTDQIVIDEIKADPDEELDPEFDHALLMRKLPENRWLDRLLVESKGSLKMYIYAYLVTKRVVYLHEKVAELSTNTNEILWGSYEQLRKKLDQNFDLIDLDLDVIRKRDNQLAEALDSIKKTLPQVFMVPQYRKHFEWRIKQKQIKRCHGDLKSTNICITKELPLDDEECVQLMDTIDFNPAYCNIDVLSDFAMLVIDIQARTSSAELADLMINYYLELTHQEDKVAAKSVLAYYLVEKALVGTIVNVAYDNSLYLGLEFLRIAERRLEDVKFWMEVLSQNS